MTEEIVVEQESQYDVFFREHPDLSLALLLVVLLLFVLAIIAFMPKLSCPTGLGAC